MKIQDTKDTVFLIINTNDNNTDLLKDTKLGELVDIFQIDNVRYNELDGNDSFYMSIKNKHNLSICLPKLDSTNANYNPTRPITNGIQFVAMNYQNIDNNLKNYNNLFKLAGCNAEGIKNDIPLLKKPDKYIEVPYNLSSFFNNN